MENASHEISLESLRHKEPADKAKLKPDINDKHKEKNEKLLSKKRPSIAAAGKKLSKLNPVLSGKLALSRQKEVEIFDSHAIDFGQVRKPKLTDDVLDNAFLPRHLRKRVGSLQIGPSELSNASQSQIRASRSESEGEGVNFTEESRVYVGESSKEPCDGRRTMFIISEYEERRRSSFMSLRKEGPQHDTLGAFMKYRRENLDRNRRLKQIQAEARVLDHESNEPIVKSLAYRRKISLPRLDEHQTEAKTYARKRDRYKLPKLKNIRKGESKKDSRFEKLLSSLVPQEKRHSDFHRRGRHFTI